MPRAEALMAYLAEVVAKALAGRVEHIELDGDPVRR